MNIPFFSVIIPTYNRALFIKKAIQSVIAQTFTDFELIIIDDASTDNTREMVQSFSDSRIIYMRNETNLERCISRNKGIILAKGNYICFLDSDDYHLSNHLEVLYNAIKVNKFPVALFFTNAWNSSLNGNLSERVCPPLSGYNIFHYIVTYTFNPQRMCIHRSILQEFLFDPNVFVCEDLDLSARIATKYQIIHVPERTTVYVNHPDSFTGGDTKKPFKELENYRSIFAKPELRNKIPSKSKRRIISMCFFHIAIYYEREKQTLLMYNAILKSIILYPTGYNHKTNKIIFVMFLYNLPIFGKLIKYIRSVLKKRKKYQPKIL